MKTKHYISALLAVVALSTVSCDDYLTKDPYDSISDTDYWLTEDHARTYSYGFYPLYFIGYGSGTTNAILSQSKMGLGDTFNDDIAHDTQSEFTPIRVPDSDGSYCYDYVRKANYMIEKVSGMSGLTEEQQNHWLGIGRFFRGLEYCDLTMNYGDVIWYDHRLSTSERDEIFRDRDPRQEVDKHVIDDFRFALENVRTDDGTLTLNRYSVAAFISRAMLREGTFLKYHNIDAAVAQSALQLARDAALVVMESNRYSVCADYNSLFSSDNLSGNTEVIFYREYAAGINMHAVLAYNYTYSQTGISRALAEAYLTSDGLPVHMDAAWAPTTAADFFANRDGRLSCSFRADKYYIRGEKNLTPLNYSTSGYSMRKFMDESKVGNSDNIYTKEQNITDCPLIRLGEVLLNYAEARYELGELTQADLDRSINLLRARATTALPALQMIGGQPAVNGEVYDDPRRDPEVPSLLWEIRRERRVELAFEGHRYTDLKRWKKLDYMYNGTNPDIRYGAYIVASDYPDRDQANVVFENEGATEGFILCNRNNQRSAPTDRNYVKPVPKDQIQLYKDNGYTLTQTPGWE